MRAGSLLLSAWTAGLAVPVVILAGLFVASGLSADSGGVAVSGAWIRLAPPVVKVHAGYFRLSNGGTEERSLVAVESPAYSSVEMHVSREVNGIATMEHLARVTVPPDKSVAFAPGGLHLMLMGPREPQKEGAFVPLTLVFGNGARVTIEAVVMNDMKLGGRTGHDDYGTQQHKGM